MIRFKSINIKSMCMGAASETLYAVQPDNESKNQPERLTLIPSNMTGINMEIPDALFLPKNIIEQNGNWKILKEFNIIPDGNRGAIVPDLHVELWSRQFVVGIKGIGARMKMYKDTNEDGMGVLEKHEPEFYSEAWFGENPWGAMSYNACLDDQLLTELSGNSGINGFYICPMIRATPLDQILMKEVQSKYWYRRLDTDKPYYQQFRLMPSDVRLFYQSEATLGKSTQAVIDSFNINTLEDLDMFIDNYISSGLAALTLFCRTLKHDQRQVYLGLDYSDVWLDKDSVIAPDGNIFFADIEGLEWVPVRDAEESRFKFTRQFDRNFYEFMYGADCLLKERAKMGNNISTTEALRKSFAARLELAVENDPFIELEHVNRALYLILKPNIFSDSDFRIKILDFYTDLGVSI